MINNKSKKNLILLITISLTLNTLYQRDMHAGVLSQIKKSVQTHTAKSLKYFRITVGIAAAATALLIILKKILDNKNNSHQDKPDKPGAPSTSNNQTKPISFIQKKYYQMLKKLPWKKKEINDKLLQYIKDDNIEAFIEMEKKGYIEKNKPLYELYRYGTLYISCFKCCSEYPLNLAIKNNAPKLTDYLLSNNYSVNIHKGLDGNEYTYYFHLVNTCERGHLEVLKIITKHYELKESDLYSLLRKALKCSNMEIFGYLLNINTNKNTLKYFDFRELIKTAQDKDKKKVIDLLISTSAVSQETIDKTLKRVCKLGYYDIVALLIERGSKTYTYNRLLCYACRDGNYETAKLALQYGADANHPDIESAILSNIMNSERLKILALLIKNGLDLNRLNGLSNIVENARAHDQIYGTHILNTIQEAYFEKIITDMEKRKEPLSFEKLYFRRDHSTQPCCKICNKDVDIHHKDTLAIWPCGHLIHKGCLENHLNAGHLYLGNFKIIEKAEYANRATISFLEDKTITDHLVYAIKNKDENFTCKLINNCQHHKNLDLFKTDEYGFSTFDIALQHKQFNVAKTLLEYGVKPCRNKNQHLVEACKYGDVTIVQYLLDNGANINTTSEDGQTTLDLALQHKQYDLAEYLYSQGISTKIDLDTVLLEACYPTSNPQIIQLLERFGGNIHARTEVEGFSALDIVWQYAKIIWGALHAPNRAIAEYLMSKNVQIYGDKEQYLFAAIKNNDFEAVKYLVEHGANVRAKNAQGFFPADTSKTFEILEYLLEQGGIFHNHPEVFLHAAITNNRLKLVRYLIRHGADIESKNMVKIAKEEGYTEIVTYLKKVINIQNKLEELITNLYKPFKKLNESMLFLSGSDYKETQEYKGELYQTFKHIYFKDKYKSIRTIIETILTLAEDEDAPPCMLQMVVEIFAEIYKKHPGFIKKYEILSLYKKIPFNTKFINDKPYLQEVLYGDSLFKQARIFAAQEQSTGSNAQITDIHENTIEDACILHATEPSCIDQIIANTFSEKTEWYTLTKKQLSTWLQDNDTQNNLALLKLSTIKKMSPLTYKNILNRVYLNSIINKNKIGEISSQIVSFLDAETMKDTIDQIPIPL